MAEREHEAGQPLSPTVLATALLLCTLSAYLSEFIGLHAGSFYFDDRDPEQIKKVVEAGEVIMKKCIELGGSLSGEHGIGVEKMDLMPLMFSEDDLKLQAMAKRIFNEGELCNPCKVIPNQKGCIEHQRRWRGVAW